MHDKIPDNAILCPIAFASKSLSSVEWNYSSIEHEALEILHGLVKFHHYSFVREVCIITYQRPMVMNKDVAMLSQQLQCILLQIHQYRISITYMPDQDLHMAD